MSRGRKYLVMAACMSLQATSSGIGYGLGIMYPELIRVFCTTSTEAALVQSIFFGIATGSGIIWSGLMRRYGSGYFVIHGGLLACTGLVISSLASNVSTIIIGTGVITGTTKEAYGSYNVMFYIGVVSGLYVCMTTLIVIFIMRHRQRRSGYEKLSRTLK